MAGTVDCLFKCFSTHKITTVYNMHMITIQIVQVLLKVHLYPVLVARLIKYNKI